MSQQVEISVQADNPKDRPFNSFRSPLSEAVKALVADISKQIENYERHRKPRKRARKAKDQVIFEATISAVVCDLIHRYCEEPTGKVAVSLSNRVLGRKSRYRAPALGKTLPTLLGHLSAPEMDFIRMEKGSRQEVWGDDGVMRLEGRQTTIQAGPRLINRIGQFNLDFSDLGKSDAEEIIILKSENKGGKSGVRLEYEDTQDTHRFRHNLRAINDWLALAHLQIDEMTDGPTDTSSRRLIRVFNNGSFNQGGRLWGGFWMNLKKEVRRNDLIIEDEPVAELDFGQMALRMLYGRLGVTPPPGDLYDVPGLASREGVKKIINAALFSDKRQLRMPQGTRQYFPDTVTYRHAHSAISEYHAPIETFFFKGVGMELMLLESEIMVNVLLRVREHGKVALPLHDGVLTSQSAVSVVKEIMEEAFKEKTGADAVVRVETW